MAADYAFLYQLQNSNYSTLSSTNFKVSVVDDDASGLNSSQLATLNTAGKTIFSYLSVGEAESYRSYYNAMPKNLIVDQNADWGSYRVKFWDPAWQNIVINRAVEMAKEGYDGIVMDVVDVYQVASVKNAYSGSSNVRTEMMNFIAKISDATKAVNGNFKIIQNNGHDLLVNGGSPTGALNTSHLNKIDAINAESTFYLPDNSIPSWSAGNAAWLDRAVQAGKAVLAIDYPSAESAQVDFINKAIAHGYIPFVSSQALSGLDSTNTQVTSKLPAGAFNWLGQTSTVPVPTPTPTPAPTPTTGGSAINGTSANDTLNGGAGNDTISGNDGNDTVHGNDGSDSINGNNSHDGITGDNGNDVISGGSGWDWVSGGAGSDNLKGDADGDYVNGGKDSDTLRGGQGVDTLSGDLGNDHLYGDKDNDVFVFLQGTGHDVIYDFANPGSLAGDIIQISSAIYTTTTQILSHVEYKSGTTIIHLEGDNDVTLLGVSANTLTSSDFVII